MMKRKRGVMQWEEELNQYHDTLVYSETRS